MKDELGGQSMKEFVWLRAKISSYLKENDDKDTEAKGTKTCVIKWKLKFQDYKNCLKVSRILNIIKYLERKETDVDCFKEDKR